MDAAELKHRFQFHPADTDERRDAHATARGLCYELAEQFNELIPEGREKALAVTHLETAMFWANAGIAREPKPELPF